MLSDGVDDRTIYIISCKALETAQSKYFNPSISQTNTSTHV